MVKTFSSGDAAVWRFLSGTWPSQRPVVLCLFFSAMSTSSFQFTHPLSFFISFWSPNACHVSCSAYSNSGIAFPLFIYGRILVNCWCTWRVTCISIIHTNNSLNATITSLVHLLTLFSFLISTCAPTNSSVFPSSIPCCSFHWTG